MNVCADASKQGFHKRQERHNCPWQAKFALKRRAPDPLTNLKQQGLCTADVHHLSVQIGILCSLSAIYIRFRGKEILASIGLVVTAMMAIDIVDKLPEELSLEILVHLSFIDRARSCLVNRTWNRLSREQVLGPQLHLSPDLVCPFHHNEGFQVSRAGERSFFSLGVHICQDVELKLCTLHPPNAYRRLRAVMRPKSSQCTQ